MGWMDGWMDGSLGLVEYRAPYGANNDAWGCGFFIFSIACIVIVDEGVGRVLG